LPGSRLRNVQPTPKQSVISPTDWNCSTDFRTTASARRELELQLSLAESLRWTKGMGAPEIGRSLVGARDIRTLVDESRELFAVLLGLHQHHLVRLDLDTARDLGEQLLILTESANEPAKLLVAHGASGLFMLLSGEFAAARDHFEQASPRFDWGQGDFFGAFYPWF
jgi:adenylate cyclase